MQSRGSFSRSGSRVPRVDHAPAADIGGCPRAGKHTRPETEGFRQRDLRRSVPHPAFRGPKHSHHGLVLQPRWSGAPLERGNPQRPVPRPSASAQPQDTRPLQVYELINGHTRRLRRCLSEVTAHPGPGRLAVPPRKVVHAPAPIPQQQLERACRRNPRLGWPGKLCRKAGQASRLRLATPQAIPTKKDEPAAALRPVDELTFIVRKQQVPCHGSDCAAPGRGSTDPQRG